METYRLQPRAQARQISPRHPSVEVKFIRRSSSGELFKAGHLAATAGFSVELGQLQDAEALDLQGSKSPRTGTQSFRKPQGPNSPKA